MTVTLTKRWSDVFMDTVRSHDSATTLREASATGKLGEWTKALTDVVITTFAPMGWHGAAKGHRTRLLPVARQEYLALDAVAFERAKDRRWAFPVAVFELENSRKDDLVAYSLWKVFCVRAALRVVLCYRRDAAEGSALVRHLSANVIKAMDVAERMRVQGETLVVVGSDARAETFPYGFFKDWVLESNTGRFVRG